MDQLIFEEGRSLSVKPAGPLSSTHVIHSIPGRVRLRASLNGNTDIGIGQHRRVVDSIPDDCDLIALSLQTLDRF